MPHLSSLRLPCGLRLSLLCTGLLTALPALAAVPSYRVPAPGQILQQVRPAPVLPAAPGTVLALPAPAQQASRSRAPITVRQITVIGNTLLPADFVQATLRPLEGHTVTLGQLQQAADTLTQALHQRGYPLAYAYLPAQEIRAGQIHLQMVEPRYDQIRISPNSRLADSEARYTLGAAPGALIRQHTLNRGLLLLNQTPGVRVAGTLVPGTQPQTSSLNVAVHNRPLLSGSVGVNNYGGNYTGRVQWQGDVNLRNPFGYGGEIAANGLTTSGGLLHAAGLSLLSPNLWNGLRATLFASWTHYRLGENFASLDETGRAIQWGGGFSYPILLRPGAVLSSSLNFIQDRFTQQSGVIPNSATDTELNLVQWGVNGALAGGDGVSSGSVTVTGGNKVIFGSAAQAADAAGPRTAGLFWMGQFQLVRLQTLPVGLRLNAHLLAQVASKNLDPSQQLYLGGPQGIMSAAVGSGAGDQGILARLSLSHRLPLPIPGSLRAAVLLQGGEVWQYHDFYPGAPQPNRLGMAATGLGLQYHVRGIQCRFDWVHRIGNAANTAGANQHSELWATLVVTPGAFVHS
ncbi:POTRA domain-containing protein [Acidithiobacillus sp.]|uniref:ShlB/FhaC/HecB family hemolysin secretion/activation protein n=1 Tax=Acidithiobacillus sp. TaxID=1872118 RepID=UPI0025C2CEFF|nr:POTRA domain-containing protein [Acidithiobacillus sp.]